MGRARTFRNYIRHLFARFRVLRKPMILSARTYLHNSHKVTIDSKHSNKRHLIEKNEVSIEMSNVEMSRVYLKIVQSDSCSIFLSNISIKIPKENQIHIIRVTEYN